MFLQNLLADAFPGRFRMNLFYPSYLLRHKHLPVYRLRTHIFFPIYPKVLTLKSRACRQRLALKQKENGNVDAEIEGRLLQKET
jgi:hypothetical protein